MVSKSCLTPSFSVELFMRISGCNRDAFCCLLMQSLAFSLVLLMTTTSSVDQQMEKFVSGRCREVELLTGLMSEM